jgi:hypothetical protein
VRIKILTFGLISLLMLSSVLSAEEKKQINISWQQFFSDHLEKVYIIMKDGTILRHSSQNEIMVAMNMDILEEELKEKNSSIKQIAVVIHNHRMNKNFTRSDYKQYWALKSHGFDGQFLMYCHRTKKAYDIEKNKKSK